ncbi:MAG: GNAT family N-acetyltransferase [Fibrobacteres bacterium]|nr:GNAT family N-acetyltransferase [Fibrobacterota bacterium]
MQQIDYSSYFWQNDLIRLRAMTAEDWEQSYLNMFDSDARRVLQYEIELPPTINGEKKAIEQFCEFNPASKRLMFSIENKQNELVGALNINSINERNGTFSIGMQIDRNCRSKGYGTAAMKKLLQYAFYERRLNKYNGSVLEGNIASLKMLEKLGVQIEGTRRQNVFTNGKYTNEILVGLTKEDFENKFPR